MSSPTAKRVIHVFLPPLFFALFLFPWAISSPPGSTADADFHEVSILCQLGDRDEICSHRSDGLVEVSQDVAASVCYAREISDSAACYTERSEQSGTYTTQRWNSTYGYPPVYFLFHGLFANSDLDVTVVGARLINIILVTALVGLLAGLLPSRQRTNLWITILLTQMPLGFSIIASINPSAWTLLTPTLVYFSLRGFFLSRKQSIDPFLHNTAQGRSWVFLALAVVSFLIGASARYDSVFFCAIAVISALFLGNMFTAVRKKLRGVRLIGLIVVLMMIATATLLVILRFIKGSVFTDFFTTILTGSGTTQQSRAEIIGNIFNLPLFINGFYGGSFGLGWLELQTTPLVCFTCLALVTGMAFFALKYTTRKENVTAFVLLLIFIATPILWLYSLNMSTGEWVQPRYILPLFTLLVSVLLYDFPAKSSLTYAQRWLIVVAASCAHFIALAHVVMRYWRGLDYQPGEATWWWSTAWIPSPLLTIALGTIFYLMWSVCILFILSKHTKNMHKATERTIQQINSASTTHPEQTNDKV